MLTPGAARELFTAPYDLPKLKAYLDLQTPDEVVRDARSFDMPPADQMSLADVVSMNLQSPSHARALYRDAWIGLFLSSSGNADSEGAIDAYENAERLGYRDPQARALMATNLYAAGRYEESAQVMDAMLSRQAELPEQVRSVLLQLRQSLVARLTGALHLGDLPWSYDSGLEPIPEAVPSFPLSSLGERGRVLEAARPTVHVEASETRETWTATVAGLSIVIHLDPASGEMRDFEVQNQ